jgi:hypothetical protein
MKSWTLIIAVSSRLEPTVIALQSAMDQLATKKFSELQLKNAKEILKWISLNFKN